MKWLGDSNKDAVYSTYGPEVYTENASFFKVANPEEDLEMICVMQEEKWTNGPFTILKSNDEFQHGHLVLDPSGKKGIMKLFSQTKDVIFYETRLLTDNQWMAAMRYSFDKENMIWKVQYNPSNLKASLSIVNDFPQLTRNLEAVSPNLLQMVDSCNLHLSSIIEISEQV